MSEQATQEHYDLIPEEVDLNEVHDFDHEGLAKDTGGKVVRMADRHEVDAKTTRSSFPTGKGKGVPVLKDYDRTKRTTGITVPQNAKVVVTKKHVYGYHPSHGHWTAPRSAFTDAHFRESYEEEAMYEESIAGATLKAGSRPDDNPKSKIEFMQRTLGAMNGMKKEDLTKWYSQAMALIGKEADSLPGGATADANQGSIDMKTGKGPKTRDAMPKLSVREDVEEMFNGQELSEEFKDKASTLFEAAVTARISLEVAKLEEQFEEKLDEAKTEITEGLEKGLDTYLDYVVEKWMDDNKVAIESSLRNEIMEEFIGGLKNLFAENYIEMPEEKIDVVESLANKVEELEAALAESINENAELKDIVAESVRHDVLNDLAEGLTMTQAEKFFALAEGIDFDGDLDVYAKKLSVVKEQYFSKKSPTTAVNIEEETFEGDVGTQQASVSVDPSVGKYAQAISRTIKK